MIVRFPEGPAWGGFGGSLGWAKQKLPQVDATRHLPILPWNPEQGHSVAALAKIKGGEKIWWGLFSRYDLLKLDFGVIRCRALTLIPRG